MTLPTRHLRHIVTTRTAARPRSRRTTGSAGFPAWLPVDRVWRSRIEPKCPRHMLPAKDVQIHRAPAPAPQDATDQHNPGCRWLRHPRIATLPHPDRMAQLGATGSGSDPCRRACPRTARMPLPTSGAGSGANDKVQVKGMKLEHRSGRRKQLRESQSAVNPQVRSTASKTRGENQRRLHGDAGKATPPPAALALAPDPVPLLLGPRWGLRSVQTSTPALHPKRRSGPRRRLRTR